MPRCYCLLMGKHPYSSKQYDEYLRKYPTEFDQYNKGHFTVLSAPNFKNIFWIEKYMLPFIRQVMDNPICFVIPDTPNYRKDMALLLKQKFPNTQTPGAADGFYDPAKNYALAFNYTGAVLHEMAHLNGFKHAGGQIY